MRATKAQSYIWQLGREMRKGLRDFSERRPTGKLKIRGMPSNPYMTCELGAEAAHAKTSIPGRLAFAAGGGGF
jgi:hypothetical protein